MSTLLGKSSIIVKDSWSFNYVTLTGIDGSYLTLPILAISGQQSADVSINKTLGGSFIYNTFQNRPSIIKLTGVAQATYNNTCAANGIPSFSDLIRFYQNNNISAISNSVKGKNKSIKLLVSGVSYTCALLTLQYNTLSSYPYMIAFQLTLVGARHNLGAK